MLLSDLLSTILDHAGLVAFTAIAFALFAYLLYRMIYPEAG